MTRVAIIGTGIAGLGCAWFLHPDYEVTLFDRESRIGGHTNTVTAEENGRQIPIDTGFMVYNEVTYPNLTRLFGELEVPVKKTSMSFSVQNVPTGLEYNGSSLNHLFAQRRNLLSPRHWKMLRQIDRFNREALHALRDPEVESQSLEDYVAERGYGSDFRDHYLIPMSSAVWSTPPKKMLTFPAATLLRFFHNHGFLGLHTQHQWWTVDGGAREYVARMIRPFADRFELGGGAARIEETDEGVSIETENGESRLYDKVILACHGDQALRLLARPDSEQQRLLSAFKYESNTATLHTDPASMPRTKLAWASWNYRIEKDATGEPRASTIYWMNSLQGVSDKRDYFVSINGEENIREDRILKRLQYEHPLFDRAALNAQRELPKLNRRSPDQKIYFCGSYFKYGFHEDAFSSALEACQDLTGKGIWS